MLTVTSGAVPPLTYHTTLITDPAGMGSASFGANPVDVPVKDTPILRFSLNTISRVDTTAAEGGTITNRVRYRLRL